MCELLKFASALGCWNRLPPRDAFSKPCLKRVADQSLRDLILTARKTNYETSLNEQANDAQ